MRRLLSILLLALLSAPLIQPLLALSAGPDSSLPACCRRNGAHHCAASMPMDASSSSPSTRISPRPQRCPYCPQASVSIPHIDLAAPASSRLFADFVSHPADHRQVRAQARISLDRSRHKRGPPTLV